MFISGTPKHLVKSADGTFASVTTEFQQPDLVEMEYRSVIQALLDEETSLDREIERMQSSIGQFYTNDSYKR